jgi:hypothetical protein
MKRVSNASRATNLFGTGKDGYTAGSPGVTQATRIEAASMNMFQEELAGSIEQAGYALDASLFTQARDVALSQRELSAMIGAQAINVSGYSGSFADFATNGLGLVVGVGSGGGIYTSPDFGNTWSVSTPAASFSGTFRSVAYGDSRFVAVGGAVIQTSVDGVTWTQVLGSGVGFFQVIWSGSLFVAVDWDGASTWRGFSSPDGVTWSSISVPVQLSLKALAFGAGVFVSPKQTSSTDVYVSTNGLSWTTNSWGSAVSMQCNFVGWSGSLFYAYGDSGSGNRELQTSPDGITWTRLRTGVGTPSGLIVPAGGNTAYALSTTNGQGDWAAIGRQCPSIADYKTRSGSSSPYRVLRVYGRTQMILTPGNGAGGVLVSRPWIGPHS